MYLLTAKSLKEAEDLLSSNGFESFRGKQIFHWIYKKSVFDFEQMTNLSGDLIRFLKEKTKILSLSLQPQALSSKDGTAKYLFRLADGNFIESVFLPFKDRTSLCLSTQVGCPLACQFCASGQKGFIRDLTVDEIIGQFLLVRKEHPDKGISHIIFMGMGEPLLNYENLIKAIDILSSPWGGGISSRRISISTSGIVPGIKKLAVLPKQVKLSISLHSPIEKVRAGLMPINKKYPVAEVLKAAKFYNQKTNKLVTFEYLLIRDINDRKEDAEALAAAISFIPSKVNLIIYNRLTGSKFKAPLPESIAQFKEILSRRHVHFTEREKKGEDIEAACGQLWLKMIK